MLFVSEFLKRHVITFSIIYMYSKNHDDDQQHQQLKWTAHVTRGENNGIHKMFTFRTKALEGKRH